MKRLLAYRCARLLCAPLAGSLLLAGCWGWIPEDPAPTAPVSAGAGAPAARPADGVVTSRTAEVPTSYLVVAGDTLFSIAWRFRLKVSDLAAWNKLGDGSLILVGQRLRLTPPPERAGASAAVAGSGAQSSAKASSGSAAGKDASEKSSRRSASRPAPGSSGASPTVRGAAKWRWPAEGRVDARGARARAGDFGVRIMGQRGQNVNATDNGTVMYAGDGLKAYGLLVIVQHSPEWLSAYGHNDRILVKEGEQVRAGQPIATMGVGPGNTPMLHFEIRRDGKPVEPMTLLPRRN